MCRGGLSSLMHRNHVRSYEYANDTNANTIATRTRKRGEIEELRDLHFLHTSVEQPLSATVR